jgi:hypothetical protein
MSKVKIEGNASGTGTFTIAAPNSNTDYSLTLPETTGGEFVVTDSSGRVGIGTSSPTALLHVQGTNSGILVDTSTAYTPVIKASGALSDLKLSSVGNGGNLVLDAPGTTSVMTMSTNGSERMRIDSSGNLLVGTTDTTLYSNGSASSGFAYTSVGIDVASNEETAMRLNRTGGTNGSVAAFYRNGTGVGSITVTASATAYNTSSDYRLKEDWQPMSGSIDRLKNLNPVNFAWKADGSRVDGFLAHEAAEVVPEAVSGEKDAVEAIGNVTDAEGTVVQEDVKEPAELAEGQTWTKTEDRPVYQGIDQSKLVPLLTAALQEAVAKIEALETRIAALESN